MFSRANLPFWDPESNLGYPTSGACIPALAWPTSGSTAAATKPGGQGYFRALRVVTALDEGVETYRAQSFPRASQVLPSGGSRA